MNKVQVYWNSHKKLFSIRYKGKIIGWERNFALSKARFVVSEKGRQRVLREKRKSVHAWVEGSVDPKDFPNYKNPNLIAHKIHPIYNPFKHESFVNNFSPLFKISEADQVMFEVIDKKPLLTAYYFYEQKPFIITNGIYSTFTT